MSATGSVVTGGASSGAVARPSTLCSASPLYTLPAVNTGPDWISRSALRGFPPIACAYGPRSKSELTTLPLASASNRTPHIAQSSTMTLRTSARTALETSGPRIHCFITHV